MSGNMGYVGWVKIDGDLVRATSCDIRNTQAINKPPCADGTVDNPVYHLGPMEVGGSIGFPATCDGGGVSVMSNLWEKAYKRYGGGGFNDSSRFDVIVRYTDGVSFTYTDCVVETFEFSVVQSGIVEVKVNLNGNTRDTGNNSNSSYTDKNNRILTWNDVTVSVGDAISKEIRSFSCVLANNVKRHYSLDGTLEPVLITPTKRDITGKVSVIGRNSAISDSALDNKNKCLADQTISFSVSSFSVEFDKMCMFEMEEIQITNDLFETTVNYHVLTGDKFA